MLIYVVEGSTGEYSDHREWPVKAFKDEEKAQAFVRACDAEYRLLKSTRKPKTNYFEDDRTHSLDPNFVEDYTGTNYRYYSVELEE